VSGVTLTYQLAELPSFNESILLLLLAILTVWANFFFTKQLFARDLAESGQKTRPSLYSDNENNTLICSLTKRLFSKFSLKLINLISGLLVGISLVIWQYQFSPKIDPQNLHQKYWLTAKIVSNPVQQDQAHFSRIQFEVAVESLRQTDRQIEWSYSKPKLKLSWYLNQQQLEQLEELPKVGESWLFYGKLKSNHASINPASRDYEAWLFQQHLTGKFNVSGIKKIAGQLNYANLESANPFSVAVIRSVIAERLQTTLQQSQLSGIYQALLIGEKSAISPPQWQLLQDTATIHLMAISGLHMSIVAGIGYVVAKLLWWLVVYRQTRINFPLFAASCAFVLTSLYLVISGAAIPTQRAWVMVSTIILFLIIRRSFQPFSALAMAALLILLWDSRAVLNSGFWLSFLAVSLIFMSLKRYKDKPKWQGFFGIQIILSIGLLPALAWQFYEIPLYGILANLIAVPFMVFIGLPGLLILLVLSFIAPDLAIWLLEYFDELWMLLWSYLEWLGQLPSVKVPVVSHSIYWLLLVYMGFFGLLYLCSFRHVALQSQKIRGLGITTLLIAYLGSFLWLTNFPDRPKTNGSNSTQLWLTVMDVGQGQAVIIETPNHIMLYDAGATWGATTDAAKIAILPYLKSKAWHNIDLLMISHSDNDHSGGAASLLAELEIKRQLSGQPEKVNQIVTNRVASAFFEPLKTAANFEQCYAGQQWEFDGFKIEVLSPLKADLIADKNPSDNDASCVLKISNQQASILLMGDIGQQQEKRLIEHYQGLQEKLKVDLLIAGHHGSRHSTSNSWLEVTQPKQVVFSTGYKNRFRFPHQTVIQRLDQFSEQRASAENIAWWNTACSGAVGFQLDDSGMNLRYEARKQRRKWYHHSCLESEQGIFYQ